MRPAFPRLLAALCVASGIASTAAPAGARGGVRAAPPACAGRVAVQFTDAATDGDAHRMTVVLSLADRAVCTLAGFPALALPSAQGAPLPVGRLTQANAVVLAPASPAAFAIRYFTSQAPAGEPCSLSVVVNGVAGSTSGTLPIAACAAVTQLDVTTYASGTQPPAIARAPASPAELAPCVVSDLALRELRSAPAGERAPSAIYALQNRGAVACRLSGAVGARLLDASGNPFPLRFAMRTTMAMLLTLPPGYEASFTLSYATQGARQCPSADRIEVFVAPQATPLVTPASVMACTAPLVRITNLRLGIPIALT